MPTTSCMRASQSGRKSKNSINSAAAALGDSADGFGNFNSPCAAGDGDGAEGRLALSVATNCFNPLTNASTSSCVLYIANDARVVAEI